jgi:hypothetical protein
MSAPRRRRRRRRFPWLAIACLLIAIALIALHRASHRHETILVMPLERPPASQAALQTAAAGSSTVSGKPVPFMTGLFFTNGSFIFAWGLVPPLNGGRAGVILRPPSNYAIGPSGYGWNRGADGTLCIAAPSWIPPIPFAACGVMLWVRHRARCRRASAGLCTTCGYDLRATPDRCPECGTVAATATRPT